MISHHPSATLQIVCAIWVAERTVCRQLRRQLSCFGLQQIVPSHSTLILRWLSTSQIVFFDLGRLEEALQASKEAVTLRRQLAANIPCQILISRCLSTTLERCYVIWVTKQRRIPSSTPILQSVLITLRNDVDVVLPVSFTILGWIKNKMSRNTPQLFTSRMFGKYFIVSRWHQQNDNETWRAQRV